MRGCGIGKKGIARAGKRGYTNWPCSESEKDKGLKENVSMELTNDQRKAVQQWVADGASLFDVQKRLKTDFNISMTYMEARFLVLDLGVKVKDKPEPRKPAPPAPPVADEEDLDTMEAAGGGVGPLASKAAGASTVSVTMDRVVQAGAVASGQVTFSDGTHAKWFLDQQGRLGIDGATPGYRPTQQDISEFQNQLRSLLQARGYA